MEFNLANCDQALVVGAGHGIGLGICEELLEKNVKVIATFRDYEKAENLFDLKERNVDRLKIVQLDPCDEFLLEQLSKELSESKTHLDLVINSVGVLHTNNFSPEKSLRTFDVETYLEVMKVNSVITPLLAKVFNKNLDRTKPSIFAAISAKVGSIEDNRMGGWYSYRASKAALNMLIKNISIEFQRRFPHCVVLAIHPGTTNTELSKPFTANTTYTVHEPRDCGKNILAIFEHKTKSSSGKFYSWDQKELPW